MISFSNISLVFKKFHKLGNLITYLIISSFIITKKIIQIAKSNHFIGHDTFFAHLHTSLFNALCIINTLTNIKTLVWVEICVVCVIRSFFFQSIFTSFLSHTHLHVPNGFFVFIIFVFKNYKMSMTNTI